MNFQLKKIFPPAQFDLRFIRQARFLSQNLIPDDLVCYASFVRYASSLFVVPTFSGMIEKGPNDATTWAKIEALVRFASKL
jgi:hypothetical protein